jgi:RNA polymerase sigma factor (sigma-70 family)
MPLLSNAAPLAGLALRCQPDSRLVALSRQGHERAFEEIVRRYRRALVSFAGAIVPAHRAEDVVQESLAKAHAALAAGDAEIQLKPWLYTIVRNGAFNDLRDEPVHEHLDESFDGVPQPPELAARREELAGLLAEVKALPPAQREALIKRELEGRSHEEIAAALGASPGAVRALIFRARTALRDAAGMLIPMPALRALLEAGPLRAEATGAGVGGAAMGLTAGGGGGIVVKGGAALALAVLALGSGIILHGGGRDSQGPARAGVSGGGAPENDGRTTIADTVAGPRSLDGGSGGSPGEGDGSATDDESGEESERSDPSGEDSSGDGPGGGATHEVEREGSEADGADSGDGIGEGEHESGGGPGSDGDVDASIDASDGDSGSGGDSGGSSLDGGGSETTSSDSGGDGLSGAETLPDD